MVLHSFLRLSTTPWCTWTAFSFSIQQLMDNYIGAIPWLLLPVLWRTWVCRCLLDMVISQHKLPSQSLVQIVGFIDSSRSAGSYNGSVFNSLRSPCAVFHNGCANLQSHQQFPHAYQDWSCVILETVMLTTWDHLLVVLICVSLTISDLEDLLIHLFDVWSPFEKCLFTLCLFSIRLLVSLLLRSLQVGY